MDVVSNTGKTANVHAKEKGEEFGSAFEVSMLNPSDKRTDSHVQTVSSIDFELDEDLPDNDIADGSVVTESKEKLRSLCDAKY